MNNCFRALILLTTLTSVSGYSVAKANQQQLTAALLYKLSAYATFPEQVNTMTFCFVGSGSFTVANALQAKVRSGAVPNNASIKTMTSYSSITSGECQFIYSAPAIRIHRKEVRRLSEFALTVADNSELLKNGNIMSITFVNDKPVISFSQSHLKASTININSQLLRYVNKLQ